MILLNGDDPKQGLIPLSGKQPVRYESGNRGLEG